MNVPPDLLRAAFSNKHFKAIVHNWRDTINQSPVENDDLDLPPRVRRGLLKAAFAPLEAAELTLVDFIHSEVEQSGKTIQRDTIYEAFHSDTRNPTWTEQMLTVFNERLFQTRVPKIRRDFVPMYEGEFVDGLFRGPNAPFVFTRRLLGLPRMEHWKGANHGERGAFEQSSAQRAKIVARLDAFLRPEASDKPCFVLHSAVIQRGLHALAGHLMQDALEEPGMSRLPTCILYTSPSAPPYKGVDLPFMLRQIIAFYDGHIADSAKAVPDVDVRRDIDLVRSYMSRFPAVFIFDGVQDLKSELAELRAMMLDDPFRLLIEHLLFPGIWSATEPADPDIFGYNRHIILANGPCDWLSAWVSERHSLPFARRSFALTYIEDDGAYRNGSALAAYFAEHADVRSNEEPLLQCADVLLSFPGKARPLPAPDSLATAVIERVIETRPHWMLPLLFLLSTPGGLRPQTLLRVVDAWAQKRVDVPPAQPGDPLPVYLPEAELGEFCETFSAMIVPADDHTLMDAMSREAATRRGAIGSVATTLIFRSAKTVEILMEALLTKIGSPSLGRAHVLLADESLQQHTKLMRLADRDDHSSIRSNRRLLQGLYHGLLALGFARDEERLGDGTEPVISAQDRFNRIYAMFYRLLLEAPPHWEMSKVMSAERVKQDILDVALGASSTVTRDGPALAHFGDQVPPWLLDDAEQSVTSAIIANDLYIALCQATLQQNNFRKFNATVSAAHRIQQVASPALSRKVTTDALLKLEVDALILQDRLAPAYAKILRRLNDFGIGYDTLRRAREPMRKWPQKDRFPLHSRVAHFPAEHRSIAISLIERWAEILATRADDLLEDLNPSFRARGERRLFDSYVLFSLGDAFRWSCFADDPFERSFVRSGHATRVHIRVLILLSRQKGFTGLRAKSLLDLARHRADALTRTFARYPAERASMLILESVLARVEDESREGLLAALDAVNEADRQIIWATDRPRLRMRLLFERAKVTHRLSHTDDPQAKTFAAWAKIDVERLKVLAKISDSNLWIKLSNRIELPVEERDDSVRHRRRSGRR